MHFDDVPYLHQHLLANLPTEVAPNISREAPLKPLEPLGSLDGGDGGDGGGGSAGGGGGREELEQRAALPRRAVLVRLSLACNS